MGNARPCRTHYWIRDGRVLWDRPMSDNAVNAVFLRDARSLQATREQQRAKASPKNMPRPAPRQESRLKRLLRWLFG
jgi:hypothetical protein